VENYQQSREILPSRHERLLDKRMTMSLLRELGAWETRLCEKPMAISLAGAQRMVAASRKSGKKLMIAQNQRLAEPIRKLKRNSGKRAVGRVITFQATLDTKGLSFGARIKSQSTRSAGDTLQAVRAHMHEHVLTSPGEADISAQVRFYELASVLHEAGSGSTGR